MITDAHEAAGSEAEPRRERWEAAAEWPLTAAAVIFLMAYAWPILRPDLPTPWTTAFRGVTWVAWAMFVVDYTVRLYLSRHRGRFVGGNLLDLAVVVLPLLRPLRLLRLVTLLHVLNRHLAGSLRGRVAVYVSGSTAMVLFLASLAVLDAERDAHDNNITTFPDALWWALTTITTVGYGDHFPVTGRGRVVAVGLMLSGIALLGVVTASFASWLLDKVRQLEEESQSATRRDVLQLTAEVAALRRDLGAMKSGPRSGIAGGLPEGEVANGEVLLSQPEPE